MKSHQVIEELKILPANLRCYIIECNTLVILVDERGRDGAIQDLVKDRSLLRHGSSETKPLQFSNLLQLNICSFKGLNIGFHSSTTGADVMRGKGYM